MHFQNFLLFHYALSYHSALSRHSELLVILKFRISDYSEHSACETWNNNDYGKVMIFYMKILIVIFPTHTLHPILDLAKIDFW